MVLSTLTELRILHTSDLDASTLTAIRTLMDAAFDGVSEDTYENVLGGIHALVIEDGVLIGHASVVERRMLHRGLALRTGYIEGVAVRADRRRGHGDAMMAALERIVRSGYQLGAPRRERRWQPPVHLAGVAAWRGRACRCSSGRRRLRTRTARSTCCPCPYRSTWPASSPAIGGQPRSGDAAVTGNEQQQHEDSAHQTMAEQILNPSSSDKV